VLSSMALLKVSKMLEVDRELFGSGIYAKNLPASCDYIANRVAYSLPRLCVIVLGYSSFRPAQQKTRWQSVVESEDTTLQRTLLQQLHFDSHSSNLKLKPKPKH